jgi:hypothetical protein
MTGNSNDDESADEDHPKNTHSAEWRASYRNWRVAVGTRPMILAIMGLSITVLAIVAGLGTNGFQLVTVIALGVAVISFCITLIIQFFSNR